MFVSGSELLRHHDLKLVLLATAICALGSFMTLFLFAQAREIRGEARSGWLFLAGFAAGSVTWTVNFVALLAFQPGVGVAYNAALAGAAFFVAVVMATSGLAIATYGRGRSGYLGGSVLGLGIAATHLIGIASLHVAGSLGLNWVLAGTGAVLCMAGAALALDRARNEGRNVQVIAPILLACGMAVMHLVGMSALTLAADGGSTLPVNALTPSVLGYFVAAMAFLLMCTGLATTLIARGARKEAQTQLRNIANASVEGLILTNGTTVLDFNESMRAMVGPARAARLRDAPVWSVFDYQGDRSLERFETQLHSEGAPIPVEVISRKTETDGAVRRIFAVRDLRERRAAEQRILYLAHYDTLTGLPNRASFQERLENDVAAMRANNGQLAVMILDLDRFKEINDVHGHAAGDELLKEVAARIKSLLSNSEFAARLGGDEFVIVQTGREQPLAAGRLADHLLNFFAEPITISGQPYHVGVTIGVAMFPRDGEDMRSLLANADLALYRAKEHGRGRACFFTAEMDETVRERRILAQQLMHAIADNELEVHYQAQANVNTGEIIGFEALARWNHPELGYVAPSHFIGIAEETDLILHLGEWVLRRVCEEAAKWTQPYPVAVNLSPVQFKISSLPEIIHQILLETGMPANRLELEITESTLIEDLQRALDMLRRIKALGVSIAMDDFGTGYSSLSTLQAFPFDKLKIDKSFVATIGSRQQATVIVTAVLGLGRSLDIPVLAEGVENEAQRLFLDEELCQQAQGFLFGRPVPSAEIHHLVFATEKPTARIPRAESSRPEPRSASA